MKSQAVQAGMQRRRAAGATAVGRCPYGYRYDGSNPVPNPKQWDQAKALWDELEAMEWNAQRFMREHHATPKPYTGMPTSRPGLCRWIKNKMLIGVVDYPGLPTRTTTPLVSSESWYKAQRLLEQRKIKGTRQRTSRFYLLSKLVTCKKCGHVLSPYLYKDKVRLRHGHPNCEFYPRGLAEFKIKAQLIEVLRDAALADVASVPVQETVDPVKQLQLEKLLAMQAEGLPGLEATIEGLQKELQIKRAEPSANWAGYRDLLRRPGVLEGMTDEELRAVLLEFVDEILYTGDPNWVEIRLRDGPSTSAA